MSIKPKNNKQRLKILVIGDDVEALLAGFLLSEKFDVTLMGTIYDGIDYFYHKFYGTDEIKWNNCVVNYINRLPFISHRLRNIRQSDNFQEIIDYFDLNQCYTEEELKQFFNCYRPFINLDEKDINDDVINDSYMSMYAVYDGKDFMTLSNYIKQYQNKFEKYRNKVWPQGMTARFLFQDPEIMALKNIVRIDFIDMCKKLIEYCKPQFYNLQTDPECINIQNEYDYIFFTDKMYNRKYSYAYHTRFECTKFKQPEVFQYDNIYFNDDSNILRIYSNGDCYHALMKFELDKPDFEYRKEISNFVGNCFFFEGTGQIIRNHLLRNQEKYRIQSNMLTKKPKPNFKITNNKIYSRLSNGHVESIDMFVDSVHKLIEHLDKINA